MKHGGWAFDITFLSVSMGLGLKPVPVSMIKDVIDWQSQVEHCEFSHITIFLVYALNCRLS